MLPLSAPPAICAARNHVASGDRPSFALITADAEHRFGIPRETILRWWRDHPAIASAVPGGKGRFGHHLLIDPVALAIRADALGRLDLDGAARRFNVPVAVFAEHRDDPGRIGLLMALLPIAPPTGRRKRIPPAAASALPGEMRHETP